MELSREARLVAGLTLIVVPTIMYGGVTLLGVLTRGSAGLNPGIELNETQWALFRAGHAHAGFFGLAFVPAFQLLLYFGAVSLAVSVLLTGVGPVRRPRVGQLPRGL